MAVKIFNFNTGPTTVPDVGELTYNGCKFGPLFVTKISGKMIKDRANRVTKIMEYTIEVDGYVTMTQEPDINPQMNAIRTLLQTQGGALVYKGRGFNLIINPEGARRELMLTGGLDVAWGPVPELIEFQPLGAGRSAKVQWKCVIRIPEVTGKRGLSAKLDFGEGLESVPLLELNYETGVSYGEDGFSSLSIRGTLEIPIARTPSTRERRLRYTVDSLRDVLERRIIKGIDLGRFRITRREFNVSRDKRTMEWEFAAEERPYMDIPPTCTLARGTYNVRPTKVGVGLISWLCTLKGTYTVARSELGRRRNAWLAFLALLRLRMGEAVRGDIPGIEAEAAKEPTFIEKAKFLALKALPFGGPAADLYWARLLAEKAAKIDSRRVWLIDFNIDEGLYLDSKTITFSATWRLLSYFQDILLNSGVWTKIPEKDADGKNIWAASVRSISGHRSWLTNQLDPSIDFVVDFGGTYDAL